MPLGDLRPAAVLLALHPWHNTYEIILTRRSLRLRNHPGELTFPGGRIEPEDLTCEAAALRESFEELGLSPAVVSTIGRLDDTTTTSKYHLSVVVGTVPAGVALVGNSSEVQNIVKVPLPSLLVARAWHLAAIDQQSRRQMWTLTLGENVVRGATAEILRQFVDLLSCSTIG